MNRRSQIIEVFTSAIILTGLVIALTGCGHEHTWIEATCTEPKTCSECGATEGEPLGHEWIEATCIEPETCTRCGQTQGEPLGHEWIEATCIEPETCTRCGQTQGEPLGHEWAEATCTEPENCIRCGKTQGEALGHTWIAATMTEPQTCSVCGITEGDTLTQEEYIDLVLANNEFYEDDAFCLKLYAESLGYKWYGDFDSECDLSIIIDDIEYFVWYHSSNQHFSTAYTDGEKCYGIDVLDIASNKRENIIKMKSGDTVADDSYNHVGTVLTILYRLSIGDTDLRDSKNWAFDDIKIVYTQIDDAPQYFDDGFIDSTKFVHGNSEILI